MDCSNLVSKGERILSIKSESEPGVLAFSITLRLFSNYMTTQRTDSRTGLVTYGALPQKRKSTHCTCLCCFKKTDFLHFDFVLS